MSFIVTILANKSNVYGISKDVEALRRAFGGRGAEIRVSDPLEPPVYSDVLIHLEIPVYGWMPWAAKNVLVVNPEWFVVEAWRPYMSRMDLVVVKDSVARGLVMETFGLPEERVVVVPWGLPESAGKGRRFADREDAFLWMLGASRSKRAYTEHFLRAWQPSWPRLTITTTTDLSGVNDLPANVVVRVGDLSAAERKTLATKHKGHICCSMAEGFGYTAAEAEDAGAFTILNSLPVYSQDYQADLSGVAFLPAALKREGLAYYDTGTAELGDALAKAIEGFAAFTETTAKRRTMASRMRWMNFLGTWGRLINGLGRMSRPAELKYLPPRLDGADCPPISIVTLVYNRKKFFDLACHNMMLTDYPKDKIEWIVVDDSDDPAEQNTDRIVATLNAAAPIKGVYVPLRKKTTVAAKRNLGCEKATADIILMMDDDDHYPETSFRRRVAWLTAHPWKAQATAATTIACYDLQKGISAVNVPPLDIPLGQRISEATLTFYRSWWAERQFPKTVVVGEAENFLIGREESLLEIPPQQTIVAFSHGLNVSSRRVPSGAEVKPGCFWGFPRQFLEFIHGLAGVKVVEG